MRWAGRPLDMGFYHQFAAAYADSPARELWSAWKLAGC
jgi:hypothetical protein